MVFNKNSKNLQLYLTSNKLGFRIIKNFQINEEIGKVTCTDK